MIICQGEEPDNNSPLRHSLRCFESTAMADLKPILRVTLVIVFAT